MKKIVALLTACAIALSMGFGAALLTAETAAAEICIDVTPNVYVQIGTCYLANHKPGIYYAVYDGLTDMTQSPCNFLYYKCVLEIDHNSGNIN